MLSFVPQVHRLSCKHSIRPRDQRPFNNKKENKCLTKNIQITDVKIFMLQKGIEHARLL